MCPSMDASPRWSSSDRRCAKSMAWIPLCQMLCGRIRISIAAAEDDIRALGCNREKRRICCLFRRSVISSASSSTMTLVRFVAGRQLLPPAVALLGRQSDHSGGRFLQRRVDHTRQRQCGGPGRAACGQRAAGHHRPRVPFDWAAPLRRPLQGTAAACGPSSSHWAACQTAHCCDAALAACLDCPIAQAPISC